MSSWATWKLTKFPACSRYEPDTTMRLKPSHAIASARKVAGPGDKPLKTRVTSRRSGFSLVFHQFCKSFPGSFHWKMLQMSIWLRSTKWLGSVPYRNKLQLDFARIALSDALSTLTNGVHIWLVLAFLCISQHSQHQSPAQWSSGSSECFCHSCNTYRCSLLFLRNLRLWWVAQVTLCL